MSKIKLTGSNSGYVEIDSAADAGNLTLQLPTSGTKLLSNAGNVFTGITTTGQLDINGSIDVSSTSVFNNDLTLKGGSYDVLWDSSDNALEFGTNAKATFGDAMQIYHDGNNSLIQDSGTGHVQVRSGTFSVGNAGLTKTSAIFNSGSGQQLNFNNNQKFITTNTGVVVTGICTATSFSGSGANLTGLVTPLSFRNLIINGAMRIAQRGTSSTANGYGDLDRWKHEYGAVNENPTFAQVSLTTSDTPYTLGLTKTYKLTNGNQTSGLQAASQINFNQQIEAQNIRNSGWNYKSSSSYITLSFWVRSSVSQNFHGFVKTTDGTLYVYPYETGTLSANTWTKITKSIPGNSNLQIDDDTGAGFQVFPIAIYGTNYTSNSATNDAWANWSGGAARTKDQTATWFRTNDSTLEITGVHLEVGSTATAFEHRSFAEELERCKRYFFILGKDVNRNRTQLSIPFINEHPSNRSGYINLRFNPEMRATPSVTIGSELELGKPQVDMSSHKVSNFGNPHATGVYYFQYTNQTGNTGDANMYMRIGQDDNSYAEFSAEL